ncbi:hypothetical protein ACMFMG_002282 [Clarireedia jacksonii]
MRDTLSAIVHFIIDPKLQPMQLVLLLYNRTTQSHDRDTLFAQIICLPILNTLPCLTSAFGVENKGNNQTVAIISTISKVEFDGIFPHTHKDPKLLRRSKLRPCQQRFWIVACRIGHPCRRRFQSHSQRLDLSTRQTGHMPSARIHCKVVRDREDMLLGGDPYAYKL